VYAPVARQPADAAATAASTAVAVRPSTAVESRIPAPAVQQESVRSFLYPGDDELPDDVNMTIWEHLARSSISNKHSTKRELGRFRYIVWVKCPYRDAVKASALRAEKRAPGRMPIQSCGQSVSARRGKLHTEIGLLTHRVNACV